jgi:hypothetical protein
MVDGTSDGAMFVTVTNEGNKTAEAGTGFAGKCWICKEIGHRKNECPLKIGRKEQQSGTQLLLDATMEVEQD